MNANFEKLWDTAMDCIAKVNDAISTTGVKVVGKHHALLLISEFVNFRVYIIPTGGLGDIMVTATDEQRDCTEQEIRDCTAKAIRELRRYTPQGRIEFLRSELAKLEAGEE